MTPPTFLTVFTKSTKKVGGVILYLLLKALNYIFMPEPSTTVLPAIFLHVPVGKEINATDFFFSIK